MKELRLWNTFICMNYELLYTTSSQKSAYIYFTCKMELNIRGRHIENESRVKLLNLGPYKEKGFEKGLPSTRKGNRSCWIFIVNIIINIK